jgi:hypothetical protein
VRRDAHTAGRGGRQRGRERDDVWRQRV